LLAADASDASDASNASNPSNAWRSAVGEDRILGFPEYQEFGASREGSVE